MNLKQIEIKKYLDDTFEQLNEVGNIINDERRKKAYDMFLNSEDSLEDIKKQIDEIAKRLLLEYKQKILDEENKIKQMLAEKESEFQHSMETVKASANSNIPLQIKKVDVSTLSYDELDKMFFHYTWDFNLDGINNEGLKAGIGKNSEGIDYNPSIFFSEGIEGVLQTWDVWLKWRLNRLNNPMWQGKTEEEVKQIHNLFKTGRATKEQYQQYDAWTKEYLSGEYKNDTAALQYLYEYQYLELMHSVYLSFNLQEGIDFTHDQVDHKKETNLANKNNPNSTSYGFFKVMYGDYSDYESNKVDKWNMQTIPGKEIVIAPSNLSQLMTNNGKTDVYHLLESFYNAYKKNVPLERQTKFDLLDGFMEYIRKKEKEQVQEKKQNGFENADNKEEPRFQTFERLENERQHKQENINERTPIQQETYRSQYITQQMQAAQVLKNNGKSKTIIPNGQSVSSGGFSNILILTLLCGIILGIVFMIIYTIVK